MGNLFSLTAENSARFSRKPNSFSQNIFPLPSFRPMLDGAVLFFGFSTPTNTLTHTNEKEKLSLFSFCAFFQDFFPSFSQILVELFLFIYRFFLLFASNRHFFQLHFALCFLHFRTSARANFLAMFWFFSMKKSRIP